MGAGKLAFTAFRVDTDVGVSYPAFIRFESMQDCAKWLETVVLIDCMARPSLTPGAP
jgi:hypothetical protein